MDKEIKAKLKYFNAEDGTVNKDALFTDAYMGFCGLKKEEGFENALSKIGCNLGRRLFEYIDILSPPKFDKPDDALSAPGIKIKVVDITGKFIHFVMVLKKKIESGKLKAADYSDLLALWGKLDQDLVWEIEYLYESLFDYLFYSHFFTDEYTVEDGERIRNELMEELKTHTNDERLAEYIRLLSWLIPDSVIELSWNDDRTLLHDVSLKHLKYYIEHWNEIDETMYCEINEIEELLEELMSKMVEILYCDDYLPKEAIIEKVVDGTVTSKEEEERRLSKEIFFATEDFAKLLDKELLDAIIIYQQCKRVFDTQA